MNKLLLTLLAWLFLSPSASAQPFNYLHTYGDSLVDDARNILLRSDNSLFVSGACYSQSSHYWDTANAMWMNISSNGASLLSKNNVRVDGLNTWTLYSGNVKQVPDIGYVLPYTFQFYPDSGRWYEWAALIALNFQMDTIFTKTFTDTSLYGEQLYDCDVLPTGGFILAGAQHSSYTSNQLTPPSGMIIRLDAMGNLVWKQTYHEQTGVYSYFQSVQPLDNDRTLIGGCSGELDGYYRDRPWFLIINNSDGSITKDTLYTSGSHSWGMIYKDVNGGFYHNGCKDTLLTSSAMDRENFPPYIAKLDTNFNITWQTVFPYIGSAVPDNIWRSRQLQNGDYLVCGSAWFLPDSTAERWKGWAARINSSGSILWSKYYVANNWITGNIFDFVERTDGNIIFCGQAYTDSLYNWRTPDVWLLGIDANGDILEENTFANNAGSRAISIDIYPNPTAGSFSLETPEDGLAEVFDMNGKLLASYPVIHGKSNLHIGKTAAPGNYLLQFSGAKSGLMAGKRLVIE
ncbi:MAG TPA: T9SS type A sorting domain-containing protein [Flavipsychrobacter sp.]|nr:T9SS type A sorting domain-containing protein [Flavipsychrobacter sp.]